MKTYSTLLFVLVTAFGIAQTTADFENILTGPETFFNGSDGSGRFFVGNIFLPNSYDPTFDSWSGWGISNTTDTITGSFINDSSCISGSGNNGSEGYGVAFVVGENLLWTTGLASGGAVEGFYINNSTYAYRVMQDGNQFSKKFGGEDGTDPDYFFLTIKEHSSQNVNNDSINVFLADYRSDDSAEDYLLDEWTYVDLTVFGNVDTLSFTMSSSDVGMFGINTPTYFCIDDFVTTDQVITSTKEISEQPLILYPNPTIDIMHTDYYSSPYLIYNQEGQLVAQGTTNEKGIISTERLPKGLHLLRITYLNKEIYTAKFIKM